MSAVFKLQIVTPDGKPLSTFEGAGSFERELIAEVAQRVADRTPDLVEAIAARGVGFARTEAHVRADIEAALAEQLPLVVKAAMDDVLYGLKRETLKVVY